MSFIQRTLLYTTNRISIELHTRCVNLFYFISDSGRCFSFVRTHKKRVLLLDLFHDCGTSYKIDHKSCNHILLVNAPSMLLAVFV